MVSFGVRHKATALSPTLGGIQPLILLIIWKEKIIHDIMGFARPMKMGGLHCALQLLHPSRRLPFIQAKGKLTFTMI